MKNKGVSDVGYKEEKWKSKFNLGDLVRAEDNEKLSVNTIVQMEI